TRVREMEEVETHALEAAQREAEQAYGPAHRFTPGDIRRLHRMWLGEIYPWAGRYCAGIRPVDERGMRQSRNHSRKCMQSSYSSIPFATEMEDWRACWLY